MTGAVFDLKTSAERSEGGVTLLSAFGHSVWISRSAMTAWPTEGPFLQFFCVCAVLILMDQHAEYVLIQQEHFGPGHFVTSLVFLIATAWLWLLLFMFAVRWLTDRGYIRYALFTFCTVPLAFILFFVSAAITHPFIPDLEPLPIFSSTRVTDITLLLCMELIFIRFVAPGLASVKAGLEARDRAMFVQDSLEPEVPFPPASTFSGGGVAQVSPRLGSIATADGLDAVAEAPVLDVAGKEISLSDLILIRSEDHYLRIYHSSGETLIRGALRDLEDSGVGLGMRINRSTWILFSAILEVENGKDGMFLTTGLNRREKVAESRRIAFAQTYSHYQKHGVGAPPTAFDDTMSSA